MSLTPRLRILFAMSLHAVGEMHRLPSLCAAAIAVPHPQKVFFCKVGFSDWLGQIGTIAASSVLVANFYS